jgi:hypothetical protein
MAQGVENLNVSEKVDRDRLRCHDWICREYTDDGNKHVHWKTTKTSSESHNFNHICSNDLRLQATLDEQQVKFTANAGQIIFLCELVTCCRVKIRDHDKSRDSPLKGR